LQIIEQIVPQAQKLAVSDLSVFETNDFPLDVFDNRVVAFGDALSRQIMRDRSVNRFPAITALAFWLRKTNLNRIVSENQALLNLPQTKVSPSGLVFHICPSNVDTMFLYSLFVSLLAGNKNVLRISSKLEHPFLDYLFASLNDLMSSEPFLVFRNYISLVRYGHDASVNTFLSQKAQVRIIWGGDNTVQTFRNIESGKRTKDILFADRISAALFNASAFLELAAAAQRQTVQNFFNDSYTFDQQGCSSPQQIFVLAHQTETAKVFEAQFYTILSEIVHQNYEFEAASLASLKFNTLVNDVLENRVESFRADSSAVYWVESSATELAHTCGGGYFYSRRLANLAEIKPFIQNKFQTLTHFGLTTEDCAMLANLSRGLGLDRVVPVGSALAFDYIWDGYNLVSELLSFKKVEA
jgi:hypothetical protein